MGAWAEIKKQVEESVTSFQERRVLVGRGSIIIIKHAESTLKTKYYINESPQLGLMTNVYIRYYCYPILQTNQLKTNPMSTRKVIYSKLATAKNQPLSCIWRRFKGKQKSGKAL